VHGLLSAEWISELFNPQIVFVLRNPFALYASYKRMRMPDGERNLLVQPNLWSRIRRSFVDLSDIEREVDDPLAFQIGLFTWMMSSNLERHRDWIPISHDAFCRNPRPSFRSLCDRLGLAGVDRVMERLASREGIGADYRTVRIAENEPTKWKKEMRDLEIRAVETVVRRLGIEDFLRFHRLASVL